MIAIVDKSDVPRDYSYKIYDNYEMFSTWLDEYSDNLDVVCRGIAKLIVVDIALNSDQDNPQLIFESMNSTGKELTQADLIRNYILMGLDIKEQRKLYEHFGDEWSDLGRKLILQNSTDSCGIINCKDRKDT